MAKDSAGAKKASPNGRIAGALAAIRVRMAAKVAVTEQRMRRRNDERPDGQKRPGQAGRTRTAQ